jgi:hypothetical protein
MKYQKTYKEIIQPVEALGFDISAPHFSDNIVEAMTIYKTHFNSNEIPVEFAIEEGSEIFPEHLWGIKLGSVWNRLKGQNMHTLMRGRLEALGFSFSPA